MRKPLLPILTALTALLALTSSASAAKQTKNPKNAILLSNVKSLTLRADAKTAHRRVSPIPQLKCNGPGCKYYQVDVMRCTNQGSDYDAEDIQWSCTASLAPEFKLGSTEVICEGFDSPDDPRVLKGSCGVEYRLVLTDKGEEKYGSGWRPSPVKNGYDHNENDWGGYLFALIFVGVLIWILYSIYTAYRFPEAHRPAAPRGNGWGGGGGGGGGWGGGNDPPPPYPGTSPYPGKWYSGWTNAGEQGWRPGFWSGALGGASAGYMAGRAGRQRTEQERSGSSWTSFGRNDGNRNTGSGSGGSSSSSGSSARYESTGFGSTSRR